MLESDRMETASTAVTSFPRRTDKETLMWRTIDISSILKVESTSKFARRIDVIISIWIRLSKSTKSRRNSHAEFRRRIDGDSIRQRCVHWEVNG